MSSFYFVAWLIFSLIKCASLGLDFLGSTPYGVAVVQNPVRFLPNAIVFEAGILLAFSAIFACGERNPSFPDIVLFLENWEP